MHSFGLASVFLPYPLRYSFGLMLWEIYTGGRAFSDVPNVLLGHQVAFNGRRPIFPKDTPEGYVELARRCWDKDPESK